MMKFFKLNNNGLVIPVTHCFTDKLSFEGAEEITPNTMDASKEKHIPVVSLSEHEVTVNVGSVLHPMTEEHSITTVILETQNGGQYKFLPSHGEPIVHFKLTQEEQVVAVYAYCNLHGLWKTDVEK